VFAPRDLGVFFDLKIQEPRRRVRRYEVLASGNYVSHVSEKNNFCTAVREWRKGSCVVVESQGCCSENI
jgi:hypothetical protein